MPHASSDHAVSVKMQREVRAGITALLPAGDFVVLHAQSLGHRFFGYFAIGPRGSGGNVSFCFQSLAKFLVRTAHMFGKSVSTTRFVALQIVSRNVIARAARGAFAAPGISPRGISGKPRSGDALQPLIQNSKAKNQTAVIHRFIRFRSTWASRRLQNCSLNGGSREQKPVPKHISITEAWQGGRVAGCRKVPDQGCD